MILCCETVHTYRCLRRNGRTEKDSVPAGQKLCHCMISTMHRERSTVLLDAIITKNQPCRWNLHSVCGCRASAWLFFHRDLDQRERCGEKDCIFRDIGNLNQPLIRDPQYVKDADYVVMESTYGDRSHGEFPDYVTELARIIQKTFDRGGNVVIPSLQSDVRRNCCISSAK